MQFKFKIIMINYNKYFNLDRMYQENSLIIRLAALFIVSNFSYPLIL
jgi:hypothetical protein